MVATQPTYLYTVWTCTLALLLLFSVLSPVVNAGLADVDKFPGFPPTPKSKPKVRNTTLSAVISAVNADPIPNGKRQALISAAANVIEGINPHKFIRERFLKVDPVSDFQNFATYANSTTNFQFHLTIIRIFNLMNDGHTVYNPPPILRNTFAILGFVIERYYLPPKVGRVERDAVYVFAEGTAVLPLENQLLRRGSQIISIDGIPVEEMARMLGDLAARANNASQLSTGVILLTLRALGFDPIPDKPMATVRFIPPGGIRPSELSVPWLYVMLEEDNLDTDTESESPEPTSEINYYEGEEGEEEEEEGVEREDQALQGGEDKKREIDYLTSSKRVHHLVAKMPGHHFDNSLLRQPASLKFRSARDFDADPFLIPESLQEFYYAAVLRGAGVDGTDVGYLQVKSFSAPVTVSALLFIRRLVQAMPRSGLIVDIRDNPGGFIVNAVWLYILLHADTLEPFPRVLRASQLSLKALKEAANRGQSGANLILPAMEDAIRYGEPFTGPIGNILSFVNEDEEGRTLTDIYRPVYFGPVVTLVNAQSASSSDLYAGYQRDYNASYVIGTDGATAGAGATVGTYRGFQRESPGAYPWVIPEATDFTTAYVRMHRDRRNSGALIEHRGVTPDEHYYRTRNDVLKGDVDLFGHAIRKLNEYPVVF